MSDPASAPTTTADAAQPARPAAGDDAAERTLDDRVVGDQAAGVAVGTTCQPDLCELGDKRGTWAGHENLECPRCGYATIDMDAARARNPRLKEG